ncbi:MAG: branched-chain amino acid ABC transporter permease [Archaeoglobaceae archaeon]
MGLVDGAIVYANLLALLSLGLTITYITTAVPNFAQGSFAVFGSYVALTLLRLYGVHPYHSIPVAAIFGGLLGISVYVFVLRPLMRRGASGVILMISTLALDLILLGAIGAYSEALRSFTGKATTKFIFTQYDVSLRDVLGSLGLDSSSVPDVPGIFFVSTLVIALLLVFLATLLYKTKFGVALRASMENPALAEVMGVNVERTRLFSWLLSGSLAAIAGCLLPFRQEIVPATGGIIIVSIFAASIVGGIFSLAGAVLGAYLIGLSESLLTYGLSQFFGASLLLYSRVVSLTMLIATLAIAPKGIAGVRWRRWISSLTSRSGSGYTQ